MSDLPRSAPPPGLIYVHDTADGPGIATRMGVKPGTVRRWRTKGLVPFTWMLGGRIVARVDAVTEHLHHLEHGTKAAA